MDKLIKAFQIFLKYENPDRPTHCEHDELLVMINPSLVSEKDLVELQALGFFPADENGMCFKSFRYGSA